LVFMRQVYEPGVEAQLRPTALKQRLHRGPECAILTSDTAINLRKIVEDSRSSWSIRCEFDCANDTK
jgi:hypothetical protein